MPAPTILKRNLEFHFPRSVSVTKQVPQTLEVIVTPLSDPSAPDQGTYVGGAQKQSVLLDDDDNVLVFQLVPTASPELLAPVTYRVAWREGGVIGRTVIYDFAMPDVDVRFDELADLGQIIGGETYLQQSDLGVPGRVAQLNEDGVPVDSEGHPAAGAAALDSLANMIDEEVSDRMAGDATTLSNANAFTNAQINDLSGELTTSLEELEETLTEAISQEVADRQAAISTEAATRAAADTAINASVTSLTSSVNAISADLANKASIDGTGRIPISQIPAAAITNAISVNNEAAMLALTSTEIQTGDLAIRPDGIYGFFGANPGTLSDWISLTKVSSVNSKQGVVNLTASDVGAMPVNAEIPIAQVTGLASALSDRATVGQLETLSSAIDAIQNDDTLVRTVEGAIPSTLLDSQVAYVNAQSQVTLKDGTVIASGTGDVFSVNGMSGAVTLDAEDVGAIPVGTELAITDITGLQTALDGKVGLSDERLTDSRTPTAHAASHAADGDDALTIAVSQVTGLSTTLSGLTTTATTTALNNRVGALETIVTDLQGTGSGSPVTKEVWWDSASALTDITTPGGMQTAGVRIKSPFGRAEDGSYYYDPAGAQESETVWPYITPNGHLDFRVWDESGDPDVVYAPQAALDITNDAVALKASQIDLDALALTVSTRAAQADVAALQQAVADKAPAATVNAIATQITSLAQQSLVDTIASEVRSKANQSDFLTLSNTVTGKAEQTDMVSAFNLIGSLVNTAAAKADLVDGKVILSQIPENIPQASIANLPSVLDAKADLVNGKLNENQIPAIPMDSVTGLSAKFDTKADLVDGKLATSQLPAIAVRETYVRTSRTAMLQLTSQQVQIGDQCIITGGTAATDVDKGTYTLVGDDPSQFSNWLLNTPPNSPVLSINGLVGNVTLSATNVGAYPSSQDIPLNKVAGLASRLDTLATTASVNTGLAGRTTPDAVRLLISQTAQNRAAVDYVATVKLNSLSGTEVVVDGISPIPVNSRVLVTAQSGVVNGIYKVTSGDWERASDMAANSYLINGTMVVVKKGSLNANSLWQMTSSSGVVGIDTNTWAPAMKVGIQKTYSAGNGIALASDGKFSVKQNPSTKGGIEVTSNGVSVDPDVVARKHTQRVPGGSNIVNITHNLNTTYPMVQVFDSQNNAVLVGWTATGENNVSLEFASAVTSTNEWRVVVIG